MTRKNILFLIVSLAVFAGCSNDPLDIDASQVDVKIDFEDINRVMMETDSAAFISKHHEFKKDYTNIYNYLIGYCMEIGDVSDSSFYSSLKLFREDPTIQKLQGHLKTTFGDSKEIETQITDGFKHLKYHINDVKLPSSIVFINSLYRSGVFCTETEIGIGLEQFLGKDNEVIKQLSPEYYFDWMKEGMERKYLERDVLTGWIETHVVDVVDGSLAENIIRWGKIIYLTEAAFPEMDEALILRYTSEDYKWALENEEPFWNYLVDEKLLFKIDDQVTRNMVGHGPFTAGLPEQDSPDRLGQFLGWRMVHKYMEKNDVTVESLLTTPYNTILQDFEIE